MSFSAVTDRVPKAKDSHCRGEAVMISIGIELMMASNPLTRRDFLKTASAATLSALAAGFPRAVLATEAKEEKIKALADTVIVLWMGGGMAHTETFDPKRYAPFEKGMKPDDFLSTFPS